LCRAHADSNLCYNKSESDWKGMRVDPRLERALIAIARRYAPDLVPQNWQQAGDYRAPLTDLARALASHGALAMMGDPAPGVTNTQMAYKAWVDGYSRLYNALSAALFPSFTGISSFFVDHETPQVVVIVGEATPVIEMLAGHIAPYIVARQGRQDATPYELNGLMETVLEELEAHDLPGEDYRSLRTACANLISPMLFTAIRQYPVTPPLRQMPANNNAAPPPPPDFPEMERLSRPKPRVEPEERRQPDPPRTRDVNPRVDPLPPPPLSFNSDELKQRRQPPIPSPEERRRR
jgi:hypothetical protein